MPSPLRRLVPLVLVLFGISFLGLSCGTVEANLDPPSPTSTETHTPSLTPTETATLTETPTLTATPTDTATATSTYTPTSTATPTATRTYTATPTIAPSPTITATTALTPTAPLTLTVTPGAPPTLAGLDSRTLRIPILMYHHIAVPPPGSDSIRVDLSVPPDVFEAEMKLLYDQGAHAVSLSDVVNYLVRGAPLPPQPVVITFDDGYDDNYTNAFPTLKDFGFIGTFFVITGLADSNAYGYLTWDQIQEMAANGMEIGSHSVDHRFNLGSMPKSVQWEEIKPAYDDLLQHLPNQPPVFAYPSGSYNATTVSLLQQLGYVAAVTTRQSTVQYASRPLELRRIRIRGPWTLDEFTYWLHYWTTAQ